MSGPSDGERLLYCAEMRPSLPADRAALAAFARKSPPPGDALERVLAALLIDGARCRWISPSRFVTRARDALEGTAPGRPTEIGDLGVLRLTTLYGAPAWRFERDDGFDTGSGGSVRHVATVLENADETEGPAERPAPCAGIRARMAADNAADNAARRAAHRAAELFGILQRDARAISLSDLIELEQLRPDLATRIRSIVVAREHDAIRAAEGAVRRDEAARGGNAARALARSKAKRNAERRAAWGWISAALLGGSHTSFQIDRVLFLAGICDGGMPDPARVTAACRKVFGAL